MIHPEMTERFSATSGLAVLLLFVMVGTASAQGAKGAVKIEIYSVLAADTNQGCDHELKEKELSRLRKLLDHLFHYSTYRVVTHEVSNTGFGDTVNFTLPGGRVLHLEPRGMDGDMIQMESMLFQGGEEPMMTTDLKIMNNGIFIIGGPRYSEGTLIITIKSMLESAPPQAASPVPASDQ
jgi:hypothetical protein